MIEVERHVTSKIESSQTFSTVSRAALGRRVVRATRAARRAGPGGAPRVEPGGSARRPPPARRVASPAVCL